MEFKFFIWIWHWKYKEFKIETKMRFPEYKEGLKMQKIKVFVGEKGNISA